jgi:hypothetical protein
MRCRRLATSEDTYRYTKIPRIHRILPLLHTELLKNSKTSPRSDEESCSMELGPHTNASIRRTENKNVPKSSPDAARLQQEVLSSN